MKVPKYVMDIIVSRRNAAERFLLQDARLSKWLRHNGIEVSSGVLQKNMDKDNSKRRRGTWTCARPVTQIVPNRKKKSRQRIKQETKQRIDEEGR